MQNAECRIQKVYEECYLERLSMCNYPDLISPLNKMMTPTTFADILEAAEQLPLEAQENLIHILQIR